MSSPLLLFPFTLFFYVKLKRGEKAYLGKAEACCGVEDVTGEKEFRHSSDSVQPDVGRTELGNHSVVIFAQIRASCVIHDPVPSGSDC